MKLYIDLETYCDLDLKVVGTYRYAEHPSLDVLMAGYSVNGEPAKVVVAEQQILDELTGMLLDPGVEKIAHNANFDRVALSAMLARCGALEPGEFLDPVQWTDTMAQAAVAGYPKKLDQLAKTLKAAPKDTAGTHLINFFAKPLKGQRRYAEDDPDRWQQFIDYCRQDVDTLVEVAQKLPELPDLEKETWILDQVINDRGIDVDMTVAHWGQEQDRINAVRAKAELEDLLGIENAGSVHQVRPALAEMGLKLPNLQAATVEKALDDPNTTAEQARALRLRQELSLTAAKKYTAAINMTNDDGRFRSGFQYHGAITGRWSGRGIQLQNLPRAQLDYPNAGVADAYLGLGASAETLKAMVRPMLTGPFIVSDFAAIEARVLAWIAGEAWALEAFRDDRDIYVETANRMGGLTRQQGKVAVLALGYAGGVGSLRSMGGQGSDAELDRFKNDWRKANRNIVRFWYDLEEAFEAGSGVVGSGRVAVTKDGRDRFIQLPSGRSLAYRNVRRIPMKKTWPSGETVTRRTLTFMSNTGLTETYSGKLAENVTQAIARDLLAEALLRLDRWGYRLVGHVHDEVIVEITEDTPAGASVEAVEEVMARPPSWAEDLPLGAEGFRTYRYQKG